MPRKEKITKILDKYWIRRGWIESDESMVDARPLTAKEELADAIMAIPIHVPSEEEIYEITSKIRVRKLNGQGNMSIGRMTLGEIEWKQLVLEVTQWMRDEILKRNGKD